MSGLLGPFLRAMRRRSRIVSLAGFVLAVAGLVVQADFFLRPGLGDVVKGLSYHLFGLALSLVLTARSRTVSLPTLANFWLLGVWAVFTLSYLLERPFGALVGSESSDTFVAQYWGPLVEEAVKLAPVAIFLVLACRGRRQSSMTDGLLLGFAVGAGVAFHEDAHVSRLLVSGEGWSAEPPWSLVFPTSSPVEDLIFSLNHALWAGLSGLGLGAAILYRHRPWTRAIAVLAFLLALTNHMMVNHFLSNEQGVLELLGRRDAPWLFATIKDLTNGGRVPMFVLIVGAIAAAVLEWRMLRLIGKQDVMFPPMPSAHLSALVKTPNKRTGFKQLESAEAYLRLRRSVQFAAWRALKTGARPQVTTTDLQEMKLRWSGAGLEPASGPGEWQPRAARPLEADAPAGIESAAAIDPDPSGT